MSSCSGSGSGSDSDSGSEGSTMEDYGDGAWWSRGPLLGSGGSANVYMATSSGFRFKYRPDNMAVKSAKESDSSSLQFEKDVFDQLGGCPDIIQCFGDEWTITEDGEKVYNLLLEYAAGGTLFDAMNDGALSEDDVRSYARSIVSGIKHMHDFGYVHCDMKPENILLVGSKSDGFTAKIADLGVAKRLEGYGKTKKRKRGSQQQQQESDSKFRGTIEFAAPEILMEGVQEAPSDIWALGCVVLEMLTGKSTWGEMLTLAEIASKIKAEGELPVIPSELSMNAKSFLELCLTRNPKDRCPAQTLMNHPFLRAPKFSRTTIRRFISRTLGKFRRPKLYIWGLRCL